MRALGKRVYRKVSGVRIPPSPPSGLDHRPDSVTVALVCISSCQLTGVPLNGLASVIAFYAWWLLNIGFSEWVLFRITSSISRVSP